MFRWFLNFFHSKSPDFKIIIFDKSCHPIPDQDKLEIRLTPSFLGNDLKIKNVRLRLSLYHDWLPDLNIRLIHKDRSITLLANPFPPYEDCCGSFNDWLQTSVFNGGDVYGEWKIIIEDTGPGDSGELFCAELELTVAADINDRSIDCSSQSLIGTFPRAGKKYKKQ